MEVKIKCPDCSPHPTLAIQRDGKIYIKCRCCKREHEVGQAKEQEKPKEK